MISKRGKYSLWNIQLKSVYYNIYRNTDIHIEEIFYNIFESHSIFQPIIKD